MTPILIDCDPGIDDALALLLAAGSEELEILAVTAVAGNRPLETTARNARAILDLAGKHAVPVYAGASHPLTGLPARCNEVHGLDGLGGVDLGAAGMLHEGAAALHIVRTLRERPPQSVTLAAIGPLTNLALAEALAPGVLRRARRVLVMGGALRVPGNITPAAEFNFHADALAADRVLRSGADIVLFPLDVTGQAEMPPAWIVSFDALDNRCGRAAGEMLRAYALLDPLLHDACPLAYLADPMLFGGERLRVRVDWRPGFSEGHCIAYGAAEPDAEGAPELLAITSVRGGALLELVRARIARLP